MNGQNLNKVQTAEQLTDAFRIFNQLSENLSVSYQGLEEQIAKLHRELAFAHSERLKSLEEKEKLANRLEKILAALPAGVIVLDVNGRIIDCNSAAVQFLGEALMGMAWFEVMARCLIPVSNNPHECELTNGQRVTMVCSQTDNGGGQIILLTDVSEMRVLQDMLNQQKHLTAMGEMVASMAHQVRTPLATAVLYASQMSNAALDQEKRQKFSQKILERLLHLERQVNDMLIFAKDGRLAMEQFSLAKLLQHLEDGFFEYSASRDIKLQIVNQALIDEIVGNENALRGALMNLLNNAVDAVAGYGKVELLVTQSDTLMRICITDDGPGIPEQLRQRIFEPFFSTKANGTGLGLAVVETVIRAHDGAIQLDQELGQGTAFLITLPIMSRIEYPLPGGFSGNNLNQREIQHESV